MGENICKLPSDKGLITETIRSSDNSKGKNIIIQFKKWAKDLNRHFSKDDIWMADRYVKRCSTSLIIREMQIKATMRYHLTPIKMVYIQKWDNNKCWIGYGEKGPLYTIVGNVNQYNHYGEKFGDASKN